MNEVVESEVPETGGVTVDDVLAAIQQKNLNTAKNHFQNVMGIKVNDALENEKVKIANAVFNNAQEEESEEEEDFDLEDEVGSAFDDEEDDAEDN